MPQATDQDPRKPLPWFIHTLGRIYSPGVAAGLPDGSWVYAVAEPYTAGSIKAAWWVLTGRAYALAWPKAGDVEDALSIPRQRRRSAA